MAQHQSKARKETVGRVMHEFKHGELETSHGREVRNPKQAIAIAMHEAGASNQQSGQENQRAFKRTKARERHGETAQARKEQGVSGNAPTRQELYEQAKRRDIPGRSKMSKSELQQALGR